MIEEVSEPPPVEGIRPSSRYNINHNNNDHPLNDSVHIEQPSITHSDRYSTKTRGITSNNTTNTQRNHLATRSNNVSLYRSTLSLSLVPILLICLAALPTSMAQTQTPDPYTSYQDISYPTLTGSPYSYQKPTPILNFFSKVIHWFIGTLYSTFGYEEISTTSWGGGGYKGIGKRELDTTGIVEACMIPVLVALSGIFAGLTLGYFSIDQTQLQVLSISGNLKQQEYARKIMPVRKDSHLLLTTLILGNMIVNEALPVITDGVLGGGIQAVVISTALVVIFAEIIPQSVCSRYGLLIGATMAKPVRVLMWIAFPIAWPIAKLLEYILGAHHGIIYRRQELRELIKMHAAGGEGGGDLDFDTVTMAQGALSLAQKTVKDAMTSIDDVFMLPIDAKLDYETLGHVVRSGHSRVPVYSMVEVPDVNLSQPTLGPAKTKMVKKVLGSLLVKSCVLLDPEDATPLASIPINAIPSVPWDEPLTNMLNAFQEGRSHMAIVSRRGRRVENDPEDAESVMTAAAGGLRQRFMRKVASKVGKSGSSSDSTSSDSEGDAEKGLPNNKKKIKTKKAHSNSNSSTSTEKEKVKADVTSGKKLTPAEEVKNQVEAEKKKKSLVQAAKLTQLEQAVPADAQMAPERVERFFEGLEGAPLGIITLEDVLEELIGEEIYDEYDDNGGTRLPASAFVPREAALAARNAAIMREKAAAAALVPLPTTNDADLEPQAPPVNSAPRRMPVLPKLPPMPKFSLGKRPASQPGKSRDEVKPLSVPTPAEVPVSHSTPPVDSVLPGTRTASPARMGDTAAPQEVDITDKKLDNETPKSVAFTTEPVPAVPTRLLPSSTPTTAPPVALTPTLLNEALLIERGRRRLGLAGSTTQSTGGLVRTASTPAVAVRGSGIPTRQPTPVSSVAPAPGVAGQSSSAMAPPAVPGTQAGTSTATGIVAPVPKRTPMFKSIPAPVSAVATPKPEEHKEV